MLFRFLDADQLLEHEYLKDVVLHSLTAQKPVDSGSGRLSGTDGITSADGDDGSGGGASAANCPSIGRGLVLPLQDVLASVVSNRDSNVTRVALSWVVESGDSAEMSVVDFPALLQEAVKQGRCMNAAVLLAAACRSFPKGNWLDACSCLVDLAASRYDGFALQALALSMADPDVWKALCSTPMALVLLGRCILRGDDSRGGDLSEEDEAARSRIAVALMEQRIHPDVVPWQRSDSAAGTVINRQAILQTSAVLSRNEVDLQLASKIAAWIAVASETDTLPDADAPRLRQLLAGALTSCDPVEIHRGLIDTGLLLHGAEVMTWRWLAEGIARKQDSSFSLLELSAAPDWHFQADSQLAAPAFLAALNWMRNRKAEVPRSTGSAGRLDFQASTTIGAVGRGSSGEALHASDDAAGGQRMSKKSHQQV